MTQEDKELLLKDLSARLTYGVIVSTPKGVGHLCSINQTIFGNEYGVNIEATKRDYFNDNECDIKPYLRPMSSMTEEENKAFAKVMVRSQDCSYMNNESATTMVNDWYLSKGFDVRGLIPRGLAIEAPEEMYN